MAESLKDIQIKVQQRQIDAFHLAKRLLVMPEDDVKNVAGYRKGKDNAVASVIADAVNDIEKIYRKWEREHPD